MSRIVKPLNDSWRFTIDKEQAGLREQWQVTGLPVYREVTIPHTFNVESETQDYRGMAWYEYHFTPKADWENKRIRIQFNGVYRDADIWVNGNFIGRHYNSGFTTFVMDTNHTILINQENILTVCVQNHYSQEALPLNDRFDWADDGGIYREVSFIITEWDAFDYVKLMAVPEITAAGKRQRTAAAAFSVHAFLCDTINVQSNLFCSYKLYKGWEQSKELIYSSDTYPVTGGTDFETNAISIDKVALWHFDNPQLYTVILQLYSKDKLSDELSISFGFRELKNQNSQLILNGEIVRLVGTEWMPGSNPAYGNAEPKEYIDTILAQLKEANCIFTRFHWQQDEAVYEWCDRNGMLVQEEIPSWGLLDPPGEVQMEVSKCQADEMIKSHGNHPSIISWGMANELLGQAPETAAFMNELRKYIKSIDPNRLVTYTTNTVWEGATTDATLEGDILMINDYIGTWHGSLDPEAELRKVITANPNRVLIIAEFGLCEPKFSGGDQRRSLLFKNKMDLYRKFPEIGGIINFCLNDYRTQMGEEGKGMLKRRVHGSTDIFGEPKPSYYIVREDCSPLKIVQIDFSADICTLTLQAADKLPSYLVEHYYIRVLDQNGAECSKVQIPALTPADTCKLSFAFHRGHSLQICRPNGFTVLTYQ